MTHFSVTARLKLFEDNKFEFPIDDEAIAKRCVINLKSRGVGHNFIAAAILYNKGSLTHWLQGDRGMPVDTLNRLKEWLNAPEQERITREGEQEVPNENELANGMNIMVLSPKKKGSKVKEKEGKNEQEEKKEQIPKQKDPFKEEGVDDLEEDVCIDNKESLPNDRNGPGYVYIMYDRVDLQGRYPARFKVGSTDNLERRYWQLRLSNVNLQKYAAFAVKTRLSAEAATHRSLKAASFVQFIESEWFSTSEFMKAFAIIQEITNKWC